MFDDTSIIDLDTLKSVITNVVLLKLVQQYLRIHILSPRYVPSSSTFLTNFLSLSFPAL